MTGAAGTEERLHSLKFQMTWATKGRGACIYTAPVMGAFSIADLAGYQSVFTIRCSCLQSMCIFHLVKVGFTGKLKTCQKFRGNQPYQKSGQQVKDWPHCQEQNRAGMGSTWCTVPKIRLIGNLRSDQSCSLALVSWNGVHKCKQASIRILNMKNKSLKQWEQVQQVAESPALMPEDCSIITSLSSLA